MHQVGPFHQVDHRFLHAPPSDQVIPRGKPDVRLPHLLHRHDAAIDLAHGLVVKLRRQLVVGDHRHLDLFQIGEITDLNMEMARHHIGSRIGGGDIDIFEDSEVGGVNRQRAGEEVTDNHVAGKVPPLIEGAAQFAFLLLRPGVLGPERQLAIHVHLMPADFVDPDHWTLGLAVVQLLPESRLLFVNRQRGNLRQFPRQALQDLFIFGRESDFLRHG